MQHIPIERLHIHHLEIGDTINNNVSGIVFLSTGLGIETCLIEDDANSGTFFDRRSGGDECLICVNRLDLCRDGALR